MEINQERIEAAIIAEAVDRLVGEDDLYSRVKTGIDTRINKIFLDSVEAKITAAVEDAIKTGFERQYFKTNSFGQQTGAATTIAAELEKLIGGYWNEKVDSQGKPTSSNYNVMTRAEWMFLSITADDFNKNMKQHVINVGGALKDGLRSKLHETVNSLLSEVFHVRSLEDQGANRRDRSSIDPPVKSPA